MADTSPSPGRWAFRPLPPEPRSIVELIRAGTLDAELAATLWLLIEGRVPSSSRPRRRGRASPRSSTPCSTSCRPASGRRARRRGRDLRLAAAGARARLAVGPTEPGADEPATGRVAGSTPSSPTTTVLLVPELSDHLPSYTWGARPRLAIRAASIGYGLAATIHADSLDEVFDALRRPPVALDDDELSRLGRRRSSCAAVR